MQQVVDWLGGPTFDGCLVFDECHKAKNFTPGKEGSSTKVGLRNVRMVMDRQAWMMRELTAIGSQQTDKLA